MNVDKLFIQKQYIFRKNRFDSHEELFNFTNILLENSMNSQHWKLYNFTQTYKEINVKGLKYKRKVLQFIHHYIVQLYDLLCMLNLFSGNRMP